MDILMEKLLKGDVTIKEFLALEKEFKSLDFTVENRGKLQLKARIMRA